MRGGRLGCGGFGSARGELASVGRGGGSDVVGIRVWVGGVTR